MFRLVSSPVVFGNFLSISQSNIIVEILSFNSPILYASSALWAFFNSPVSLNSKLMVIPAKINKTTIVTTNATNVTPLLCFCCFC